MMWNCGRMGYLGLEGSLFGCFLGGGDFWGVDSIYIYIYILMLLCIYIYKYLSIYIYIDKTIKENKLAN